jgi:hypothetical protein
LPLEDHTQSEYSLQHPEEEQVVGFNFAESKMGRVESVSVRCSKHLRDMQAAEDPDDGHQPPQHVLGP